MNHVKKVLVYFLYFDGAMNRASRGDSGFAGHGAAFSTVLCGLHSWKYAAGADYISVCQKSVRMGRG